MHDSAIVTLWDSSSPLARSSVVGAIAAVAAFFLTVRSLRVCEAPSKIAAALWAIAGGVCVGVFVHQAFVNDVLSVPEVRPSHIWFRLRIVFYAALIVLLTAITATDWRTCFIPLFVPIAGMIAAPVLAFLSGDVQIAHVWVDWNAEVPQLAGPHLPAWLGQHPHLHGLAWSLAGAAAGTAMAWVVRRVSGWVLGMPALGEGDVWLMAMIGAFLGWQPTVLAFAIAPIAALVIGLPTKALLGRPYIPYGPFLAFGALVVLFTWRWLWTFEVGLGSALNRENRQTRFRLRDVFGDPGLMIGVAAAVVVALVLMLGWRRWVIGGTSSESAMQKDLEPVAPLAATTGVPEPETPQESPPATGTP
jgi:leader peptidase (prepilin peptidase) / N-methyltransferase